jgi:hypothetical protein
VATDIVLVRAILDVLVVIGDRGRELNGLASEVELRMDAGTTVQQVEAALTFASSKGWVSQGKDAFGRPRWFITDTGRNRQSQFGA